MKGGFDFSRLVKAHRLAQLEAIDAFEGKGEVYFHRRICRAYSALYATPFLEVLKLPIADVMRALAEHSIDQMDEEEYDTYQRTVLDPNSVVDEETQLQEQIRRWEQEAKNSGKKDKKANDNNKKEAKETPVIERTFEDLPNDEK